MIDLKLNFGADGLVENLSFVLARKDKSKIGLLNNPQDINACISLEEAPSISVKFYNVDNPYWNDINMYKLIYVPELQTYYSIECETSEGDGDYKALTLTRMSESELSQPKVYALQINTEEDIIRPDYDSNFPNVLYRDPEDIEAYDDIWESDEKYAEYTDEQKSDVLRHSSILHRVLSFAPHFTVGTVDESIQKIQRIYTFDGVSVYECLNQIAEDMSIIIDYTDRTVNAYDALSYCEDCGFRGHYTGECPNCGGTNITEGFGENTGICISTEALGTDITYSRNSDAISNCYHIAGGDDTMTAAIWNCNPNGGYVWSFSDEMKNEMSPTLRTALNAYETLYDTYQNDTQFDISGLPISSYNALVAKYRALDSDVKVDPISSITGYSELIKAYYDAIDFGEYLNNGLYPSITNNETTAAEVAAGLTNVTLERVSLLSTEVLTLSAASNAVVSYAKIISDPLYDIKVVSQELITLLGGFAWEGVLSVTNYYNKDDNAKTSRLHVIIDSNIQNYAQNSVMQTLLNRSKGNAEIINLYSMTDEELADALQYYSYQALSSINDCYVKSVETLTSIEANDPQSDAYQIYTATEDKLAIITAELALRENEVKLVDFKDSTTSMVALLKAMIDSTKAIMKLENNLTDAQWIELNAFRREGDYSNDNYVSTSFRRKFDYIDSQFISDSLSNAELIKRAYEFLMQAEYKLKENNKYSYQISTTLQNLLAIPEFASLRDSFKCGNWLRVMDNSGNLYKLRLMKYEVDFSDLSNITVEFADISQNGSAVTKMQKFMMKTQDVVDRFAKSNNQNQSKFIGQNNDLTDDYNYSDAYTGGESSQNIQIMNNQVTTKFQILDGLIQSIISIDDEQVRSIIAQELDKITLSVNNLNEYSTITISYDGVAIMTSNNITLGGDVIFTSDLTDGHTIISGDNILTGIIQSINYLKNQGEDFSVRGTSINLTTGEITTPSIYIEGQPDGGEARKAKFKDVYMESGYIGDSAIVTEDDGSTRALDHASNAWKLRTAEMDENGTRYYVYMTKNKNLIVTNTERGGHSSTNDVTDQSNIGSYKYPWNKGYFNMLRVQHHNVIPEGLDVTLDASDWTQHTSGYYTQTITVNGMSGDIYLYIATKDATNLDLVYKYNLEVDNIANNTVTFLAATLPSEDIDIVLLVEDFIYSAIDPAELNADYNAGTNRLSCLWASPRDSSKFITWIKDELIIEKYDEDNDTWEQVLVVPGQGETPFLPDEFSDVPLVIGSA